MMLQLLYQGEVALFVMLIIAIVVSLTFHEFAHALTGKLLGDTLAEQRGRLTLNPIAHIDPLGLLMVATVGFGWARPVPFDPRNVPPRWGPALIAAAGPLMNLVLAVVAVNILALAAKGSLPMLAGAGPMEFLKWLAVINLLLMLFNLIPLGPLDGHYVASWALPGNLASQYDRFNAQYGSMIFLVLIALSIAGVPIFSALWNFGLSILPKLVFV